MFLVLASQTLQIVMNHAQTLASNDSHRFETHKKVFLQTHLPQKLGPSHWQWLRSLPVKGPPRQPKPQKGGLQVTFGSLRVPFSHAASGSGPRLISGSGSPLSAGSTTTWRSNHKKNTGGGQSPSARCRNFFWQGGGFCSCSSFCSSCLWCLFHLLLAPLGFHRDFSCLFMPLVVFSCLDSIWLPFHLQARHYDRDILGSKWHQNDPNCGQGRRAPTASSSPQSATAF